MTLDFLLNDAKEYMAYSYSGQNLEILDITDNTKEVKAGSIFVCVKGKSFDGHSVASDMLNAGAVLVVVSHDIGLGDKQIIVEDTRRFYGILIATWNNHPEKKLTLVGVTGTNGKTTIATMLHHILNENAGKTALIGTAGTLIGNKELLRDDSTPTTPKVKELYSIFAKMVEEDCKYVVMEVSSFATDQNRIGVALYKHAIFTNLTQDHLDYHGDMESYYEAKKILFTNHTINAYINTEDAYGKRLYDEISCNKYTLGVTTKADFYADNTRSVADGSEFAFIHDDVQIPLALNMVGSYNISNAISALAVCYNEGITIEQIKASIKSFRGVRGRCEIIPTGRNFTVVCDYAHSPDAIENVLIGIRPNVRGRLICLFGCGGDRDRTKRPLMAKAAYKYADYLIVTSDNPRSEDPNAIIDEIFTGLTNCTKPCDRVADRREAIYYACRIAKEGDVIVLAGKGHEDYQIINGNEHIHFDEREVTADALAALCDYEKTFLTLKEIATAINGEKSNINDSLTVPSTLISSDTRTIKSGSVFIAIKGDNFDGHDYIEKAIELGAIAVICEKAVANLPCIVVKSTRLALLDLAGYYRKKFNPVAVGITGSVGKTTTKEFVSLALSSKYNVLKTQGNHNNEIGVPLTLFELSPIHTAIAIEMGMSDFGEIERISTCAMPEVCIITNIGCSHMEHLGSREGILKAKCEIIKGASPSAPLIVNGDDDLLFALSQKGTIDGHSIITCAVNNDSCDYVAKNIVSHNDGIEFDIVHENKVEVHAVLTLPGIHNVTNALLAYVSAIMCGCDKQSAIDMLLQFKTDKLRQHIEQKNGMTIITDCYNAAPDSMHAAINTLAQMTTDGKKICVFGDMLELGDNSIQLHSEIGEYCAKMGIDMLFCYGEMAKHIAASSSVKAYTSMSKDEIAAMLKDIAKSGDIILFKASRGMKLEEIIAKFLD